MRARDILLQSALMNLLDSPSGGYSRRYIEREAIRQVFGEDALALAMRLPPHP